MSNKTEDQNQDQTSTNARDADLDGAYSLNEPGIFVGNSVNGPVRFPRANHGAFPDRDLTVHSVTSVFIDRFAGVLETEEVLGENVNANYLARLLADNKTREAVAEVFCSNKMDPIVRLALSDVPSVRISGDVTTRELIVRSVGKYLSGDVASVVSECLNSLLISVGLAKPARAVFNVHEHSVAPVKVTDLVNQFRRDAITKAINEAKRMMRLDSGKVYSLAVICERVTEALMPLGVSLLSVRDFEAVLRDVVRGVRKSIDPMLHGLKGEVPDYVVRHEVVRYYAGNLTFLRAAMDIEDGVSIETDGHVFEQWAPTILASLKANDRYVAVGRSALLDSLGLNIVRDLKGKPVRAFLWEHVEMDPTVSMAAAFNDAVLSEAKIFMPAADRIGDHWSASFGNLPATFSVASATWLGIDVARDMVQMGEQEYMEPCLMVHTVVAKFSLFDLAAILAGRISFSRNGKYVVFHSDTKQQGYTPTSGSLVAGRLMTSDPVEVILCHDEFSPSRKRDYLPQVISREVMGKSVIGAKAKIHYVPLNNARSFSLSLFGHRLQGSINPAELKGLRSGEHVSVLIATYNRRVVETVENILRDIYAEIQKAKQADMKDAAVRRFARRMVTMCTTGISPGFAEVVHEHVVRSATASLSQGEAAIFEAQMGQDAIRNFTDVISVAFFLAAQGLTQAGGEADEQQAKNDAEANANQSRLGRRQLRSILVTCLSDKVVASEVAQSGRDSIR